MSQVRRRWASLVPAPMLTACPARCCPACSTSRIVVGKSQTPISNAYTVSLTTPCTATGAPLRPAPPPYPAPAFALTVLSLDARMSWQIGNGIAASLLWDQ